jgi:hypothetical protein
MSRDIQRLLQECLDGYDAGLSPEECLSAYPDARSELEPLLRQALSLRVAYAAAPSQDFRFRAREKLLFAAGRDVKAALSVEPDPQFVDTTRRRLLNTAGAAAQEALRDVPPPRLPFWANARRHLLENASVSPARPSHALAAGVRSALSAAVVVVAVAVAGAAFFLQNSPANEPPRSAALVELDYISDQVATIEQLRANGETVSTTLLDDLAERTSQLAEQYGTSNSDAELIEKLPDLIQRQLELAESSPLDESVAAAQERLAEADQKVASAAVNEPQPTGTSEAAALTSETPEPSVEPSPEPSATPEIGLPEVTLVEPGDLSDNQIAVQLDAGETALGLRWLRVTTSTVTFLMPENWEVTNLEVDEDGLAVLPVPFVIVHTDLGLDLLISTLNGEVNTVLDGQQFTLRSEGADGSVIEPARLAEITAENEKLASLYNMLTSLEVVEAGPEDTETPVEVTETP